MKIDPVNTYRFTLLKNQTKNLLHVEAKMLAILEEETSIDLKIHKQLKSNDDFAFYDMSFRSEPMNHEEERILIVTEYYTNQYELLPKKITLLEDQYVVFQNTQNYISFYNTLTQKTKVKLPVNKSKVISYTKENAVIDAEKIYYRHEESVKPFSVLFFKAHYECNFSLVVFNNVEKVHWVSHWGNIAVEEKYQIENIGAKLVGEFGRVDYDDEGTKGGKNALRALYSKLPLRANNLWYRDEIGNVSSSRAFRDWDDVKLDLELRFPLLGGWKSNYNVGYSLPTKFHVNVNDEDLNLLNLTYGLGYDDILAKNYTYTIVLPEHADVAKINLNIDSSNYKITYDKTYSFLDLFGRTTVIITMNNVFDIHRVPIEVS
jgi:oligosaccharyltransferase complex subunit alpha (ribophorin I)